MHLTERMKRQAKDDAALLRAIVESATDYAIITTDSDGTITSWSPGARNLLGWEEHEALGQEIGLIFTDPDKAAKCPMQNAGQLSRLAVRLTNAGTFGRM